MPASGSAVEGFPASSVTQDETSSRSPGQGEAGSTDSHVGASLGIALTTMATSDLPSYTSDELELPGPGTYERLLARLEDAGVDYHTMGPHEACRTSEDSVRVRRAGGWEDVNLESGAKAMLLRTAKGGWLLAVLPADRKLSWKKIRAVHGKGTRMASEEEVAEVTGCLPGAVPPISVFPQEVAVVADPTLPTVINFNCGLRTRSIQMTRASYEMLQQPTFADIVG